MSCDNTLTVFLSVVSLLREANGDDGGLESVRPRVEFPVRISYVTTGDMILKAQISRMGTQSSGCQAKTMPNALIPDHLPSLPS